MIGIDWIDVHFSILVLKLLVIGVNFEFPPPTTKVIRGSFGIGFVHQKGRPSAPMGTPDCNIFAALRDDVIRRSKSCASNTPVTLSFVCAK